MKRKMFIISVIFLLMIVAGSAVLYAESSFLLNPCLGNVTVNSVDIRYQTQGEVDTYVQYAIKSDYDAGKGWTDKTVSTHGEMFRFQLTGLRSNEEYVYQVVINDESAMDVYSFYTAPEEDIEFTFLAYGDTRSHQEKHKLLADKMAVDETNPRFVFHVGDLVANGGQEDLWPDYSNAIKQLGASMPYYAAIGNHEFNSENYYNSLALPQNGGGQNNSEWFSFNYAGVHFIVLDTNIMDKYINENVPNAVEMQREWLLKDLEANKDTKWIIAVFHHPIFSSHNRSRYPKLQEELIPLFDQYGVDLILNGHNHIYERVLSGGRNYITTGAGGAPFDYVYEYEPRLEDSVAIEDALLEYARVRVTADKLYVEIVRTHDEADDFCSLVESFKVIDYVEIENIPSTK